MQKTETIKILDNSNSLYEVLEEYLSGSVKIFLINEVDSSETELTPIIDFAELGEKFIIINNVPATNSYIKIAYRIMPLIQNKNELYLEIKSLKEELQNLKVELEKTKVAVDNRVNVSTFQAWITLIENELGIKLEQNLKQLYSTTKVFKR